MKEINKGDLFKVRHDSGTSKLKDERLYSAISENEVRLVNPSEFQIGSDGCFRDGTYDFSFISQVEPDWYKQRGYEFKELT